MLLQSEPAMKSSQPYLQKDQWTKFRILHNDRRLKIQPFSELHKIFFKRNHYVIFQIPVSNDLPNSTSFKLSLIQYTSLYDIVWLVLFDYRAP